jgi:hypothetical protein
MSMFATRSITLGGDMNPKGRESGKQTAWTQGLASCPLCGSSQHQRKIKTQIFSEKERDPDQRPAQYFCTVPALSSVHPPLFYFWHCSNCHFTAPHIAYDDPWKSKAMTADKLRVAVKDGAAARASQLSVLTDSLVDDPDNIVRALRLNLLAVVWAEIGSALSAVDPLDIGRCYLRLGWFFRDLSEREEWRIRFGSEIASLFSALEKVWSGFPDNEGKALTLAADYYRCALESSYAVDTARDEVELLVLISGIYLKFGDPREAKRHLALAREKGQKGIAALDELIRKGTGDAVTHRGEQRRIQSTLERGQRDYERIAE